MFSINFIIAFLIYGGALGLAMAVLVGIIYRKPAGINSVFYAHHRPPQLKATIGAWFVLMGAVLIIATWLRFPFFKYAFSIVTNPSMISHDRWALFHAIGLIVLLLSEVVVVGHWIMYLVYSWLGATRYEMPELFPLGQNPPEVLVFVCCCNEDPEIVERAVSTVVKLDYPNLRPYLVENSRNMDKKAAAVKVAERHGLEILHVPNRGHKAGAMNDALKLSRGKARYLAVVDVDHFVRPEFVREIVPLLERDERLAFVQTPQLYENADVNCTTRAAAMQEMLLYDSILEAKSAYGRAMCCGSNFIVRIAALDDVGGWDEEIVSEDLATSYLMHVNGWTSLYHRKAFAVGIGPTSLTSYWKQQQRWASGNTAAAVKIMKDILSRKPSKASPIVRLEYLWSAGYYITTLCLALMATIPMLMMIAVKLAVGGAEWYTAAGTKPLEWVYLSVYPLYVVVMMFPYVHMRLRGYRIRNLMLLQGLLANTIMIYIASVFKGILKGSKFFVIAPKSGIEPGKHILRSPQTYVFIVLVIMGSLLVEMMLSVARAPFVWILLFWTYFYTLSFAHFFIFALDDKRLRLEFEEQQRNNREDLPAEPLTMHVTETQSQV